MPNYKLKLYFAILLLALPLAGFAQQLPGLSMYNQFSGVYNPGSVPDEYTRDGHHIAVKTLVQRQWNDFLSGPKTQIINVDYVTDYNRTFNLLLGGYIINDKVGPISSTGLYGRVGSIMSKYDPSWGGFSAGFEAGIMQYRINRTQLQEKYPDDILTLTDPNYIKPSFGIGASYYNNITRGTFKNVYINTGLSIKQLGFSQTKFEDSTNSFYLYTDPHLYFYGKILKKLKNDRAIEFNSWAKYVSGAPINVDVHMIYHVNQIINFEVGSNSSGIAHFGLGLGFGDLGRGYNLLKLNYSYNPSLFDVGSVFGSSHSLSIGYSMK